MPPSGFPEAESHWRKQLAKCNVSFSGTRASKTTFRSSRDSVEPTSSSLNLISDSSLQSFLKFGDILRLDHECLRP